MRPSVSTTWTSVFLVSLTALTRITFAAPALHARDDFTPNSFCSGGYALGVAAHSWAVYIPGQMEPSAQGSGSWGGGFLDNLRGQCGVITNWEAALDPPGTGVYATFETIISCSGKKVHDAAWLASDPNNRVNLNCEFHGLDSEKTAHALLEFLKGIFESIGHLFGGGGKR